MSARLTVAILVCTVALAQEPAFDVASVTLAKGQRTSGYSHQITPTSLTMLHVSMGHCLRLAYDIRTAYELVGPAWLDPPTESQYHFVAKVDRSITQDQIKAMPRYLRAGRFELHVHGESRDLTVYALVTTRTAPSLRHSTNSDQPKMKSGDKPYQMLFQHFSMSQFALQLGPPWTARPVID